MYSVFFCLITYWAYVIWKHRTLFIRKNWRDLQQKAVCYNELFEKQLLLEKICDCISCALMCSVFSILSAHSKKRLLLCKVLFSASCNLARSKLIFINTFIYFSSLRAILLKANFPAKQLQNCSYLKAYIHTYIHTYIYI